MIKCKKYLYRNLSQYTVEYESGYIVEQHCNCQICELECNEKGMIPCINGSCDACKNIASGRKIRSFEDDLMR